MSTRSTVSMVFLGGGALMILLVLVLTRQLSIHHAVETAEVRRYESYKLADELRQSSDDLTRFARTYVVTGNPIYEKHFHEILSIRNGESPRPENYGAIYWDLVTADDQRPSPYGKPHSLEDMMREMHFTRREFEKLQEAKRNSDELVKLETVAMNAVKGRFEDDTGAFTIEGEPRLEMARQIMHGEQYHLAKREIMRPIREFMNLLEFRTKNELQLLHDRQRQYEILTMALVGVCLLFGFFSFSVLRRSVSGATPGVVRQGAHSRQRLRVIAYSILTMTTIALAVALISIYVLYQAAFRQTERSLVENVASQARLIEAIARFNQLHRREGDHTPAIEATIDQIVDAHKGQNEIGRTGEFTFARLKGKDMEYILKLRYSSQERMKIPFSGSSLGEPMRRALSGQIGSLIGPDYRGQTVVAAYEPLGDLGLGMVAKVDLHEIRAPFAQAGLIALVVGMLLILGGGMLFAWVTAPLIKQVEDRSFEAELLHRAARTATTAESFEDALQKAVTSVCELTRWSVGHVYLPDEHDSELLIPTGIWHIEHPERFEALREMTQGTTYRSGMGLPGRILASGQPESVPNVLQDPDFQRHDSEADIGVQGAFGFPVTIRGRTVAVLEFFAEEEVVPDERFLQVVRNLATQLSQVFERKRAEETLRKLTRAVEQTSSMVFITDTDGIVEYVNPKFSEVTGISREDAVGKTPRILKSGEHSPDFYTDLWRTLLEGREWHGEFRNRKKNGDLFWVQASLSPIRNAENDVTHFIAIEDDVTDRKEAEKQLRSAREQAEAANQAKSAFLANMSHELRTPMNAIIGYSEMLVEEAEDLEQDDFIPDLQKINSAGRHLLALINDILDLSKIEAGKMDLYLETFEVGPMLQEVAATVDSLIKKNQNALILEFDESVGDTHSDLTKMRQVLFNLISNAAKFTREGAITLRAQREKLHGEDWLRFQIQDSGIGIAEDKIESLFDEFTQADASTTRKFGGTGLGLAITKRFCELMGGSISVESTPDVGSTFTVLLPAVVKERTKAPAPERAEPESRMDVTDDVSNGGQTILIIDDEATSRDLLQRALTRDGFHAVTAEDGPTGLELARRLKPRVITLDLVMPRMDGWSVLTELKNDPELKETPVVMVTILDEKNIGYTLGAADYLTKPIQRDQLLKVVRQHASATGSGRVLVVEDDPHSRELMARMLSGAQWSVTEAVNGADGLAYLEKSIPDLILLDLMMPVMDGFEFVLRLRRHEQWRSIPVVVVTAKVLTREDHMRLNGHVERVLQKGSFSRDELLEEVRNLVAEAGRCNTSG